MNLPRFPVCCRSSAYDLFAHAMGTINKPEAILEGAVAIAMHSDPVADLEVVKNEIEWITSSVHQQIGNKNPSQTTIQAHLHDVFFAEHGGFRGSKAAVYRPEDCMITNVLTSRYGGPTTLSLIYYLVAEQLGFLAWGIALPGHFIIGIKVDEKTMFVDPFFEGRHFTPDEIRARYRENVGIKAQWDNQHLRPASPRMWFGRLTQIMINAYARSEQYHNVAAMLELQIQFVPDQDYLKRDLGLTLGRIGKLQASRQCLEWFLERNPHDRDKHKIQGVITRIKNQGRSP